MEQMPEETDLNDLDQVLTRLNAKWGSFLECPQDNQEWAQAEDTAKKLQMPLQRASDLKIEKKCLREPNYRRVVGFLLFSGYSPSEIGKKLNLSIDALMSLPACQEDTRPKFTWHVYKLNKSFELFTENAGEIFNYFNNDYPDLNHLNLAGYLIASGLYKWADVPVGALVVDKQLGYVMKKPEIETDVPTQLQELASSKDF